MSAPAWAACIVEEEPQLLAPCCTAPLTRTPFPSPLSTCLPVSLPACLPLSLRSTTLRRILGKLEGVSSIATDVGAKSVVVSLAQGSPTTKEALLEALQKWGKAAAKSVELDE